MKKEYTVMTANLEGSGFKRAGKVFASSCADAIILAIVILFDNEKPAGLAVMEN